MAGATRHSSSAGGIEIPQGGQGVGDMPSGSMMPGGGDLAGEMMPGGMPTGGMSPGGMLATDGMTLANMPDGNMANLADAGPGGMSQGLVGQMPALTSDAMPTGHMMEAAVAMGRVTGGDPMPLGRMVDQGGMESPMGATPNKFELQGTWHLSLSIESLGRIAPTGQ